MNNKKYPIILITLMLCSYLAPVLDSHEMSDSAKPLETSSRSTACIGDICISEVLVNAFGAETGAVGPADWTSGEWVELYNAGTSTVDLSTWTLDDHYDRPLSMTTNHVVYPSGATDMDILTDGTDKFVGGLYTGVDDATGKTFISGASNDVITMNGSTKGGLAGSIVKVTAMASAKYAVEGIILGSGTLVTPFADA